MVDRERLYQALRNADAASDTQAAKKLADYIRTIDTLPAVVPKSVEGNSFLENVGEGLKHGATSLAMGVKQRMDDGAAYLEDKFGGQSINAALGMKNASDIQREGQTYVDTAQAEDAPLMATGGGKVGNFIGHTVPAAAAMLIPGMQGLAGSAAIGATQGFVEPTATGESVLANTALGGVGGTVGYGAAKGIGAVLSKAKDVIRGPLDAAAMAARDAGYVLPPTQTNPSLMNNLMEGLSGKLQMRQQAAMKNQPVTNALAAKALGLPEGQPITAEALSAIRKTAGTAYEKVKSVGTFGVDEQYAKDLAAIGQKYTNASNDFPALVRDDIPKILESFKPSGKTFDSGAAIDAIGVAREMADAAYGAGNKALGGAYKSASKALEGLVERNLSVYESQFPGQGFDVLLGGFQSARQTIAKTYTVQKALNPVTGDVSATVLGGQLKKGAPLSEELAQIAEANRAFPHATKVTDTSMPGVSPLDLAAGVAASLASHSPIPMMLGPGRMAARSAMLSGPYQATFGQPGIVNAAAKGLGRVASEFAPIGGAIGSNTALAMRGPGSQLITAARMPGPVAITENLRDNSDIDQVLQSFGIKAPPGMR